MHRHRETRINSGVRRLTPNAEHNTAPGRNGGDQDYEKYGKRKDPGGSRTKDSIKTHIKIETGFQFLME